MKKIGFIATLLTFIVVTMFSSQVYASNSKVVTKEQVTTSVKNAMVQVDLLSKKLNDFKKFVGTLDNIYNTRFVTELNIKTKENAELKQKLKSANRKDQSYNDLRNKIKESDSLLRSIKSRNSSYKRYLDNSIRDLTNFSKSYEQLYKKRISFEMLINNPNSLNEKTIRSIQNYEKAIKAEIVKYSKKLDSLSRSTGIYS